MALFEFDFETTSPRWATRPAFLFLGMISLMSLLGCGPMGPFAGGALSGVVEKAAQVETAWGEGVELAQLETRPSNPHSVNTWFLIREGQIFVPTSMILGPKDPSERSWVQHVAEDPNVRIRVGDRVFERVARRLTSESDAESVRAALEARYDLDPAERDPERMIWIYALDPR